MMEEEIHCEQPITTARDILRIVAEEVEKLKKESPRVDPLTGLRIVRDDRTDAYNTGIDAILTLLKGGTP
jgi:hypothetical protein